MISFFVPGKPIPQGSAKAFVTGGKARIVTGAQNEATPLGGWRARIAEFAFKEMQDQGLAATAGPICLHLIFVFERPKALSKKLEAPATSRRCGDIDKLQRSVLDGLTGVCYEDDCQVVTVEAFKAYAGDVRFPKHSAGVYVTVEFGEELP